MYDLVVVGAGPAGYVCAIRASQLGLKVCVVEKTHLGGICLNWGCIPTKALLKTSELFYKIKKAEDFGIKVENVSFDIKKVVERSRTVSTKLAGGIAGLFKKHKIDVIMGEAKFVSSNQIDVDGKKIDSKKFVIATGARARVLKGFEPDQKLIWTYREAMVPDFFPKSICVVGSGAIGMEFASFYANLGAKVTVLEAMDRILPAEDEEISKIAKKSFENQGMIIETSAKLESVEKKENSLIVKFNSKSHEFERMIIAIGVVPNTESIGLEKTKVKKTDAGHILTDEFGQTADLSIFAIGDVCPGPWLAHKASHEGVIVAEWIAGKKPHPINRNNIPGCTYTRPQIASVGISEKKAKEQGIEVKIGRFQPLGNGKAIASGSTEGLVKTIFDAKTGELLGAHMIGEDVTEMISAYLVGKNMEATEEDFISTIFPHPTLSEMMHESVLDAFGKVLHS